MKALGFTGRGGEYFRIWIVNILLTIVTLSFYYPWAKVRNRRYFFGNTTLEGRSFDYHATGKQLLPGYLIVMVLVVLYVGLQTVFPVAGLALVPIVMLAVPWIIWRSLKFNMRMTSFSTVRFGFEGSAGGAYASYLFWPLLFVASLLIGPVIAGALGYAGMPPDRSMTMLLGLVSIAGYGLAFFLYVSVKKRQTRYVINGFRYGQGRFATGVRARGFAMILLKTIALALLLMLFIVALAVASAFATGVVSQLMPLPDAAVAQARIEELMNSGAALSLLGIVYAGFLFAMFVLVAYAFTRKRRYILAQSSLDDDITFASTLGARRFLWVLLSNLLLVVLTLGLGVPWARTRLARVLAVHTQVDTRTGFDAYMSQQRAEQSSLGEQIGDAFDVDVGIGF